MSDVAAMLNGLRTHGWSVAVHNDYRLNGEAHTFWLMTKGNLCAKGEGRTDLEALTSLRAAVESLVAGDERMRHDYPLLQHFHTKHALGAMSAPSCLCYGYQTGPDRHIAVRHMELPAIVICAECKNAADHARQRVQPASVPANWRQLLGEPEQPNSQIQHLAPPLGEGTDGIIALPARGLHALKYAVQMLRESGWYRDEEGDATNALEELLEALAAPAPSASTAPAKDHESDPIEPRRQDDWASAPAPQAQPVAPPDGWKLVAVNEGFEPLMAAMARAHSKGYMPDAITDDYEGFDYQDAAAPESLPVDEALVLARSYGWPVSAPDDRELMERARLLCEWIAETPHQRGSINGAAAQLEASLRARLGEGAS